MAQGQVSLSTKGKMVDVLAEARRTFPDAQNDSQALTRALFHWLHNRQENSKRGAIDRVEKKLDKLIEVLEKLTQ